MKFFILLSVAVFSLSYINTSVNPSDSYFPLKKGQTMTYKYGAAISSDDASRFIVKILNETKQIEGKDYLVAETSYVPESEYMPTQTTYLRINADGDIYSIEEEGSTEELVFPAPPYSEGQEWTSKINLDVTTSTIINTNGSINTNEKEFTGCIVVETKATGGSIRSYYQKGIGMVVMATLVNSEENIIAYITD